MTFAVRSVALQLMLILLMSRMCWILDEPSNDLDTDMLAAMEDLC